ncbi:DUF5667 domain-containing protein [Chloroflexota bacterium]
MKRTKEFDNILDECLERILNQGETVAQCLARYPKHADELKPLLETTSLAKRATEIEPGPEFRTKARHEFHMALQEMGPVRGRWFSGWRPQWATVLTSVLVLLLASSGTVAAASDSMPDEPLYPVKLATETVRLALTPSALGKAELYVKLADKRVAEITSMADKGKAEKVEQAARLLSEQMVAMAGLVASQGKASRGEEASVFQTAPPPAEEAPKASLREVPQAAAENPPEMAAPRASQPLLEKAPAPEIEKASPAEKGRPQVSAGKGPQASVAEAPVEPGLAAGEKDNGRRGEARGRDTEPDRKARLKELLVRRAFENREELRKALEKTPDSAKPALKKALEIAEERYEEALESLEKDKD